MSTGTIAAYNPPQSRAKGHPVFSRTRDHLGTKAEYNYFRTFDLLAGGYRSEKLFFYGVEDYVHYLVMRSLPNDDASFDELRQHVLKKLPASIYSWHPRHASQVPDGTNQFPPTLQVFAL